MDLLVAVGLGAVVGLGLFLVVQGLLGRRLLSARWVSAPASGGEVAPDRLLAAALAALLVGVAVLVATGWWMAAVGSAVVVVRAPFVLGRDRAVAREMERTRAVAVWTEMIRDNMAGAAGLEQALQVSATLAPAAIEDELTAFGRRLERRTLDDSLLALGADLDNPAADLVVAALVNASRMEVRELGPLLSRLAEATRADVAMRQRIEVGRARIRTSARIVMVTTAVTIVFLTLFSRELLAVYDTLAGQLWLVVVAAVFAVGGSLLRGYGQFEVPTRFVARRSTARGGLEEISSVAAPAAGGGHG